MEQTLVTATERLKDRIKSEEFLILHEGGYYRGVFDWRTNGDSIIYRSGRDFMLHERNGSNNKGEERKLFEADSRGWKSIFYNKAVIQLDKRLIRYGENIKPRVWYMDKWKKWDVSGEDLIIENDNKIRIYRENIKILENEIEADRIWTSYGGGYVIARGNILTFYKKNGEIKEMNIGEINGLRGYGNGVAIRQSNVIRGYREGGESFEFCKIPTRASYKGNINGVVINQENKIVYYKDPFGEINKLS